ncbi:MAG: FecR family protein, partial [Leptolyngbyaceae cyanobacterium bins.59]|nr:FecR family protein [Leptolyngbyaceae cyanobacterium bins.59]
MFRPWVILMTAALTSAVSLPWGAALAEPVPLSRAVVQNIRNQVRLLPQNQAPRSARVSDALTPGDALATAVASLAELRFNDGSLARVGERAVFRFVAKTRTFELSNGTALFLIPPKRGGTRVRTPNATAGIRGSALFVRYNPDTDTTIVGVLTNNPEGPIVITNNDGSQSQPLRAGEMAVVIQGQIGRVYQFDLSQFYQTSELVRGLNLNQAPSPQELTGPEADIAQVRGETSEALTGQSPLSGAVVLVNPDFIRMGNNGQTPVPGNGIGIPNPLRESIGVESLLNAGETRVNSPALAAPASIGSPAVGTGTATSNPANDGASPGGSATGGASPGGGATGGA